MRGCARPEAIGSLLAALLALGGCQTQSAGGEFEINAVEARWANGRMRVHSEQVLRFSEPARQALGHGVPLTIELELILRNTASQTRVAHELSAYEIRYLPMSEHYQVARLADGQVRTYPRLRHALADLGQLDLDLETGALAGNTLRRGRPGRSPWIRRRSRVMGPSTTRANKTRRLLFRTLPLVALLAALLVSLFLVSGVQQEGGATSPDDRYLWVLVVTLVALLILLWSIGYRLLRLVRNVRAGVPGARLAARWVRNFLALSLPPALIVFFFSAWFLSSTIDSWFIRGPWRCVTSCGKPWTNCPSCRKTAKCCGRPCSNGYGLPGRPNCR
jgi:hypothetical protein